MNHLEELVAEWYEYTGYFVLRNIRVKKRAQGGYEGEIDVLAYKPKSQELTHIEVWGSASSWQDIEKSVHKKFSLTIEDYESVIDATVQNLKKIGIVGWPRSTRTDLKWAEGVEILLIPEFLNSIASVVKQKDWMSNGIPEKYPLLRTIQLLLYYYRQS